MDKEKNEQTFREKPEKQHKKKKGRKKLGLLLIGLYALIMALVLLAVDGRHVRFYMVGGTVMPLECGEAYQEPGIYAVTSGRLFGESARKLPLETEGQVDSAVPGSYELTYSAKYLFREYSTSRVVNVQDTLAPEIILERTEGYAPSWLDGYVEEGYTAIDLHDGDLTGSVQREDQGDKIVYTVTDSAGNTARVERVPEYAVGRPEIVLNGGDRMEIRAYRSFNDPGFTALDAQGNDLSGYVQVEGEVVSFTPGEYQLTYSVSNALGETVSAVRTVEVLEATVPETVQPDENTIYLTFDDGPGPYTDELLDILAKYNAKATFFVTCANKDYFDCVGRAYREGHSIGVHSASHNYYQIYESETAFFDDFNRVEDMIYNQTGSYTDLCRFPGGSSNTVSNFNPGIMTRLTQAVRDMGYQYFDWNVTSGDAGETTDTDTIVDNIIGACSGRKVSVVLQHDIKDYSVAAVERVLIWGLNNGYVFRALDVSSPSAHHGIAN